MNTEENQHRARSEGSSDELKHSEAKLRRIIDTIPVIAWCGLPDRQSSGIAAGTTTQESALRMQQVVGAEQQFTQKTWSNWKRSGTRTLLRERPASSTHACDVLMGSIDGSYSGTSRCGTSSARSSIGMERIPISMT